MNNCATIVRLGEIRKHPNADRLNLTVIHGNQVLVGLDVKEGDIGIYFECGLQLSEAFATANDLLRRKNPETGVPEGGMFDEKRRVRAQKLRGEISDGFWCPLSFLSFITTDSGKYPTIGTDFTTFIKTPICSKYIPSGQKSSGEENKGKTKGAAKLSSPMFLEHFNTEHFGKNIHKILPDSRIIITEKLHGTSQRVGYVQIIQPVNWLIKIASLLTRWECPVNSKRWIYLNGTRRVVLNPKNKTTGFHAADLRDNAMAPFIDKLHKGETVYFEVVGYEPSGKSIMPSVDNKKLDKDFVSRYGDKTTYSYGCAEGSADIYVYRITLANEDGFQIDYSWEDMKKRCGQIGVKYCPELQIINCSSRLEDPKDYITPIVEELAKGQSTLDSHIKEGVCVRIEGGLNVNVLKHKSFEFKVLEGIVKDAGVVDMEEEQSQEVEI